MLAALNRYPIACGLFIMGTARCIRPIWMISCTAVHSSGSSLLVPYVCAPCVCVCMCMCTLCVCVQGGVYLWDTGLPAQEIPVDPDADHETRERAAALASSKRTGLAGRLVIG
jgi:hypothetical protein